MDTKRKFPESWQGLSESEDQDIGLLDGALLIAKDEYQDLDLSSCRAQFQAHVASVSEQIETVDEPLARLRRLNQYLFQEQGFVGNESDYYDPRNSYLNEVLARRLGNPISLSILQLELGQHLGLPLEGVSFPGHFLVRLPTDDGLLVLDPFHKGRSLGLDELRERAAPHFRGSDVGDEQMGRLLEPANARTILARVLRNLKQLYLERDDIERALRCSDRLITLHREHDAGEFRDRGDLYQRIGHQSAAVRDWKRYLEQSSQADDAEQVRQQIVNASGQRNRLN